MSKKQFTLDSWLKDKSQKVVTRCGFPVKIVCTDVKRKDYPILALVEKDDQEEYQSFTKDGRFSLNFSHDIFDLFIETADEVSEDEKIRKRLIQLFQSDNEERFGEFTNKQFVAWLEKKGEPIDKIVKRAMNEKQRVLLTETNGDANIDWDTRSLQDVKLLLEYGLDYIKKLEKQGEQKKSYDTCDSSMMDNKKSPYGEKRNFGYFEENPVDNVEPKFKVGVWVVDNCGYIWKIEGIINQFYILEGVEGGESRPTIEWVNKTFHLWTIQDAKDGDVLISKYRSMCIFKDNKSCYCYIDTEHKNFYAKNNRWFSTDYTLKPATKEQRDLLFQKMHEAGYTFDFEKKELKKIEQKPTDEEMKRLLQTEYEKGRADVIAEIQKEWSEEDEIYYNRVQLSIEWARAHNRISEDSCDEQLNWLKSLRPQNKWKPSDEQMKQLHKYCPDNRPLTQLYQDLKKLEEV